MAVRGITKREAEELFNGLRDDLMSAERRIVRIIKTRAWEPLNYESFAQAWNERLDGISLATGALKAHVVYALLDTMTPEEIGATVTGVSTRLARHLKREKEEFGKRPEDAEVVVRTFVRRRPTPPQTIRVEVTPAEYAAWASSAAVEGETIGEYSAEVLRRHFTRKLSVRTKRAAA